MTWSECEAAARAMGESVSVVDEQNEMSRCVKRAGVVNFDTSGGEPLCKLSKKIYTSIKYRVL